MPKKEIGITDEEKRTSMYSLLSFRDYLGGDLEFYNVLGQTKQSAWGCLTGKRCIGIRTAGDILVRFPNCGLGLHDFRPDLMEAIKISCRVMREKDIKK